MTVPANARSATGTGAIVAWFQSQSDAETAVKELLDAGLGRDAVRLMPGNERDQPESVAEAQEDTLDPGRPRGFVATTGIAMPSREVLAPRRSGRAGYLVSVETNAANHEKAAAILGRYGTIDRDELGDAVSAPGT